MEVSGRGIAVNGLLLPNTAPKTMDSQGRPMKSWPYGQYRVPLGLVWVASSYNSWSFDSRYFGPGVVRIDGQRVAVLICYEQILTYPILASMLQQPAVLVGIGNTFWIAETPIPRYQAAAVRAWARLFRVSYLLAVNS